MTVTLLEILGAAQGRCAALPGELVGYLLLAASEQMAARPRHVSLADVVLEGDGGVHAAGGGSTSDADGELALRQMFKHLLGSASPVSPPLQRIAERASGAGIEALARELEAALIPLNRAAGRRALSRLYRDTARALASGAIREPSLPADAPRGEGPPSVPSGDASAARSETPPSADHASASGVPPEVFLRSESPPDAEIAEPEPQPTPPEPVVRRQRARELVSSALTPALGSNLAFVARELDAYDGTQLLEDATERMPEIAEDCAIASDAPLATDETHSLTSDLREVDAGWDDAQVPLVSGDSGAASAMVALDPLTHTTRGLGVVEERRSLAVSSNPPPGLAPDYQFAAPRFIAQRSDVDALLRGFTVAEARSELELCRELTEIAGLDQLAPW